MKTVSVKLSEDLEAKLAVEARQTKMSKSEVVRRALDAYLNGKPNARKGSVLDLAGDIIGSVSGPGDLSTNKDYMKDYGR